MALAQAEAVVEYNKISRLWNAQHGGTYVPVTERTLPNPYLEVDNRDFSAPHGVEMTKINPAYMSRQMSELARTRGALTFRLTSLNCKNPGNKPTAREADVLMAFERGEPPHHEILNGEKGRRMFFMDKFKVEPACLSCHADQGYAVGDVRGGISVEVPLSDRPRLLKPILTHAVLFLGGGIVLGLGVGRARTAIDVLSMNATFDELTGLHNRRSLMARLEAEFRAARRYNYPLSLLMVDIDKFKNYNDHFGHQLGDECLRQVAGILAENLRRPADLVGRYGGEEFVVVLPHTEISDALRVAEKLRVAVESTQIAAPPDNSTPFVTISVGAAAQTTGDKNLQGLFERADKGMYLAKRGGRNQISSVG